jgi:alpha-L-rhamnosidase
VQWFYEDLAGMRPLQPGYALIEYRPEIPASGLDHVSASYESVRGTIASGWRRTPQGLALDVRVPANARGRVYVPAAHGDIVREVGSGTGVAAQNAGATPAGRAQGRAIFEVGSGQYEFRVERAH